MRRDEIELPNPPGVDRPGDSWVEAENPNDAQNSPRTRTWSGRRRRFTILALTVSLAVTFAILSLAPSAVVFKPGALSKAHAQILNGTLTEERCAACHGQSSLSPIAWFRNTEEAHGDVQTNQLCLECHRQTIPENLAFAAHNLPQSIRDELRQSIRLASVDSSAESSLSIHRLIPDAAIDQEDVDCATCHQEHQGVDANLLAMSNEQCQTCHESRFGAFADSHPDWREWPYGRGGEIAFNHSTHQNKHFPGWKSGAESFRCGRCHPVTSPNETVSSPQTGEVIRTASYEQSCQSCHNDALKTQLARGIEFVNVPTLPEQVASQMDHWPAAATGFADGVIPPIEELLLRVAPNTARFVRGLPGRDISRMPADAEANREQLTNLAKEVRLLMDQVSAEGHSNVGLRLRKLGISARALQPTFRSLPPQLVETAIEKWFKAVPEGNSPRAVGVRIPTDKVKAIRASLLKSNQGGHAPDGNQVADDVLLGGDLLSAKSDDDSLLGETLNEPLIGGTSEQTSLLEDPLLEDPLLEDPLLEDPLLEQPVTAPGNTSPGNTTVVSSAPFGASQHGGWVRDDQRLSIRYRAGGHADPVLAGWIETFSQLSETDPLKRRFFAEAAVAECIACHEGASSFPAKWGAGSEKRGKSFTKFSHRPHLNVSALGDCVHCHKVAELHATTDHDGISNADFDPLGKEACTHCHTPKAAGDRCTTCHHYHIGP